MKKIFTLAAGLTLGFAGLHAQTIFSEDFEGGGLPAGWSQETSATDGGWIAGDAGDLSSSSFPITDHTTIIATNDDACDCDKSNDLLISPSIDISSISSPFLKYDVYYFEGTYDATEDMTVEISTDGGSSWSVLSNLGYETGDWRTKLVDLSAYAGSTDVNIGFRYNDGGGWLFGAALDNVEILQGDMSYVSVSLSSGGLVVNIDAIPALVSGYTNYLVGGSMLVAGSLTNNAYKTINSFDANFTRGSDSFTQSFTGLSISASDTYSFQMDDELVVNSGDNDVVITISNINGGEPEDGTDNTSTASVNGVTPKAGNVVVAEEATGTWCGWCPRGAVMMEYMSEKYPDYFVGIAVHNGDPMTNDDYDADFGASAFPNAQVNRSGWIDPLEFETAFLDAVGNDPQVIVSNEAYFDEANRMATVVSHLDFQEEMNGDYRIAVVFTEDEVSGTSSSWDQANYYSGGGNGAMGGYESLGAEVPAEDIVYEHVGREIVPSYDGEDGSVPEENAAGSTHDYTTTFELSDDYNWENMKAITLVIKHSGGEIINAASSKLTNAVAINETSSIQSVGIYPNPSSEVSYIDINLSSSQEVTVDITDITGRVIASRSYGELSGSRVFPLNTANFEAGVYMVNIHAGTQTMTERLVVAH